MRAIPHDWRASDFEYTMIGLHVADFDAALDRLLRMSGRLLTDSIGPAGHRRVCLRDPESVLLELMEDDVRGSAWSSFTLSRARLRTWDLSRHEGEKSAR